MALGLLLRVSWMYLLFDCSAGSPVLRGYRYPSNGDPRKQDEVFNPETFDRSAWQALNNQPIDPVYTSDKSSVTQLPDSVASPENLPDTKGSGLIDGLLNGHLRDWSLANPEKLLVFPLNRKYHQNNPATPQPGPIQTQDQYKDAKQPSNTAGRSSQADYMSTGSSTSPPKKVSSPSNPANVGAWPVYPSGMGRPFNWFSGVDPDLSKESYQAQKPVVDPQKAVVTQRVSEPIRPHHPPPSYIVQSRNGYQRTSYLHSNSRYSPDVPRPMPASSTGSGSKLKAAPDGVKNF
ncbi:uncharacterized protein LOC116397009 [Anarrhichthys ocellatus]|uniref:uncharacterized protein LOC116397009 n=1 Tax=Anarrhichthys ocellatus TaxID=433405 RepID=UPI0012ECCB54|nr:uncharacterized protein LOC116397009 [Anarrhichthys ocellatus]